MMTSIKTQQSDGEYLNPTIDPNSSSKENPLILMAQACDNIDKELSLTVKQPFPLSPLPLFKIKKSNSPQEVKKSLKRIAPTSCSSLPIKKRTAPSLSNFSSSSLLLDSLVYYQLNKTLCLPTLNCSLLASSLSNYSTFASSYQQYPYSIDSILWSPFVCNWIVSNTPDGFCGKRFTNHMHLLEHLCIEHRSI